MNKMTLQKAALINATAKYTNVIFTILFNAILSRILTPQDFGIVAVISVFTVFFQQFADMGFGTAVIQNRDLSKKDIDNIYSMTVYLAIILGIAFTLFSYPISIIFKNQEYIKLGLILAVSLFFTTLNMIPNAQIMRDQEFTLAAKRMVIVTIFSYIITIILALNGLKYYALALQSLIFAMINFIWNYTYSRNKFYVKFDMSSIKLILSYSMYQFGASFINYFQRNLDNLLIGKYLGEIKLGLYNKAYILTKYPVSNITRVITPVLHPVLASYQNEKDKIYSTYLQVLKILSILGVFFSAFMYFTSYELIIIMFGEQWLASISTFKILSISIWSQMLTGTVGSILQSLNNTKLLFKTLLVSGIVSVIGIIMGVNNGSIEYVALFVTIIYIIHFFIYFYVVSKEFGIKFSRFIFEFRIDAIIFTSLMLSALLFPFNIHNVIISFLVKLIYMGIIYLVLLIITKKNVLLTSFIKKRR